MDLRERRTTPVRCVGLRRCGRVSDPVEVTDVPAGAADEVVATAPAGRVEQATSSPAVSQTTAGILVHDRFDLTPGESCLGDAGQRGTLRGVAMT